MVELNLALDEYKTFDELVDAMRSMHEAHPGLSNLYSIGKTLQERDLWTMELTNKATGPAHEKPGIWIDGNTHSGEVTGSAVCLKTIWHLLDGYGKDPFVTDLLDARSIFILPRLNPDGAEIFLTQPYHRTAGGIPNPDFPEGEGHYEEDVDGDGKIVDMRIKDPNGLWKVSRRDPRVMVRREPGDGAEEGPFYRVIKEGMFLRYKPGKEVTMAPPRFIGGTNRNYPAYWAPGGLPLGGAGPFPLWEREPRALADFWASHPNLSGVHTFHTSGGLVLRESITKPDDSFIEEGLEADLAAYKAIGEIGENLTGYPAISAYEEFTFEDDRPFRRGCGMSFFYEHLGALIFSIELWDLGRVVGLGGFRERGGIEFNWSRLNEEEWLKVMDWVDSEHPEGFVDWKPFQHPQLGQVEIGGLDTKYTTRNPPPGKWLEREIDRTMMFALRHAALLPLVRVTGTESTQVAQGVYRVEARIENTGFLPTNVTQQAVKIKQAKPVKAKLELPEGVELVTGHHVLELGHMEGRSAKLLLPRVVGGEVIDRSKRHVEWVVKGAPGSKVTLEAGCPRAGVVRETITLE